MLFSEHYFDNKNQFPGSIEVICGSMFSGKTEELIRRIKCALSAQLPVEIFKPKIDTRYDEHRIVSHDNNSIPSAIVSHSSEILLLRNETSVIGIDEGQFFDDELPQACTQLANRGVRVIVAGLDMDYLGRPFGPMPTLLAIAERITKAYAICVRCGAPATYSYRTKNEDKTVLLGEKDSYEPRCRRCYFQLHKA